MHVQENLAVIRENIRQACQKVNRNPGEITIIGVTKYVTIERAEEVFEAGINNLGENRLEGFSSKFETLTDHVIWHFIGSIQSRKVKDLINKVDYIHSLDRKSLAKEINKRAEKVIPCFVQVNVSGEQSKSGLEQEQVYRFIDGLKEFPNIKVIGLMTMAPFTTDETLLRKTFSKLRLLRDQIEQMEWDHAPCHYLSMGMSNDYSIAIEEGATHIRIGSKLVDSNNRGESYEFKK